MKKFLVAFFILAASGSAFAEFDPAFMIGFNGDLGMSWTIDKPKGYSAENEFSGGAGLKLGLGFSDLLMLYTGLEWQYKPIGVKDSSGHTITYKQDYLDWTFVLRGIMGGVYVDIGAFVGQGLGSMKYSTNYGASGTVDKKYVHGDHGVLIGLGLLFPIDESSKFDLGIKMEVGTADVIKYSDSNKYNTTTFVFTLGFVSYI